MYQGFARMAPLAGRRRRLLRRFAPAVLLAALLLGGSVSPSASSGDDREQPGAGAEQRSELQPTPDVQQRFAHLRPRAPGGLSSPVNGTIVRWRIRVGDSTRVTNFRIIRPLGGGLFTGAAPRPP